MSVATINTKITESTEVEGGKTWRNLSLSNVCELIRQAELDAPNPVLRRPRRRSAFWPRTELLTEFRVAAYPKSQVFRDWRRWGRWITRRHKWNSPYVFGVEEQGVEINADNVYCTRNVVAEYSKHGLVCKIYTGGAHAYEREVTAIKRATVDARFAVPFIVHESVVSETYPVVWFERVKFSRKQPAEERAQQAMTGMLSWYERAGVDFSGLIGLLEQYASIHLHQFSAPIWSHDESRLITDALQQLMDRDYVLPTSWTHGDLAPQNIRIDHSGRLTLLDWERSRRQSYIIGDVCSLLSNGGPRAFELYNPWQSKMASDVPHVMPAALQMHVVALNNIIALNVAQIRRDTGHLEEDEASRIVRNSQKRLLDAAESILSFLEQL